MKVVNFQCHYEVPDHIKWTCFNLDGMLIGFVNPPVRDFKQGVWQDSVTGGYGEVLPFHKWDVSLRETTDLYDTRRTSPGRVNKQKQRENTEKLRRRRNHE